MMLFSNLSPLLIGAFFLAMSSSTTLADTWIVEPFTGQGKAQAKFIGGVSDEPAPAGQLDGLVAISKTGDIRRAWYDEPTRRYGHGIMGDAVEGGRLAVKTAKGEAVALKLSERYVFEDRYPRLADLDGDGRVEIITIRADNRAGAALILYGLRDGVLRKVAETPAIGSANRWRNVAGLHDYDGDGTLDIIDVVTPHIGGVLNRWVFDGRSLKRAAQNSGFSNHFIGSRALELSASADVDRDGLPDLALPDASRRFLKIVSGKTLEEIVSIRLPGRVSDDIALRRYKGGPAFVVPVGKAGTVIVWRDR